MKKYLLILFLYPTIAHSQIITDTVIYVTPENDTVRVVTYHNAATAAFVPKVDTAAIIATKYKLDSTAAALAASVAATYATITTVNGKQATLISGTNIKTVNGNNLLGAGDVSISSAVAWGGVTGTLGDQTDLINALNLKAPLASPTFTGTVGGITKSMVGLGNVDNTTDAGKPVSTATQTALDLKAPLASPTFTGTVNGVTATMVGLGNVTNESKATMFTNPAFTGTPTGVGLPVYARVTGSNATTTGQALVTITGLTIALVANATYEVECMLTASTTAVTTGTGYGINYSAAGATVEGFVQGSLTTATDKTLRLSALNTSSQAWLTTSAQTGGILIKVIVTVGANAGNLTAQHLKVTSGTSTVFINSYMKATRIL